MSTARRSIGLSGGQPVHRPIAIGRFTVFFFGNGLLANHNFLSLYIMTMDVRTILNGVTYAKALRLSNKARQGTSTGELVTLMSNDAQRLPDLSLSLHAPWSSTFFIVIAIFLLVRLLGASALAGVMFLVVTIPFQGFLAVKQMGLQRSQMEQTESRVKVINEVLQASLHRFRRLSFHVRFCLSWFGCLFVCVLVCLFNCLSDFSVVCLLK